MKNKSDFYKLAKAYDIAFSDRDFDDECNFLEWCLNTHSKLNKKEKAQNTFIELCCGPARHAREFASRGWLSAGLDISKQMIEYAQSEAKKENLFIETHVADIVNYKLKQPVILSATLMESISHLVTNEQMISHFRSVAKNTVPGGLYIIEASHPMFFFPDNEENSWVSWEGDTCVEVTFGLPTDKYDTITQQWQVTTKLKMKEKSKTIAKVSTVTPLRWYLAQEMKALIELSGVFDKYWFYGSLYDMPAKPLDESENSDAMVIVLRTKKLK